MKLTIRLAAALAFENHRQRRAIFNRAARIQMFRLRVDLNAGS